VKVCDADDNEVETGEVGFLWVRGDSRATEYWQHPDKTAHAFRGPWYVSEDMLRRDAEGYFYYEGRADDMLKVSGKWLSPKEVENCLVGHPEVAEVAVVGHVDENGLTKPYAFVVTHGDDPAPELERELQQYVKDQLAPYKYPRRVIFMDDLPRTHLGKVDRGRLRYHIGGVDEV
jgi:acyl-coenzyme A synthetase/AMP-(fatty) acid ligase